MCWYLVTFNPLASLVYNWIELFVKISDIRRYKKWIQRNEVLDSQVIQTRKDAQTLKILI